MRKVSNDYIFMKDTPHIVHIQGLVMFCHGCYNRPMKKLLALIKGFGKTKKQLADEVKHVLQEKGAVNDDGEFQVIFRQKPPIKPNDNDKR
ncbi:MAG: hypothetical protein COU07_01790 [Candidatus Harrisonbacteria bacterium CG10_big_fil_rev_8_21_14_0_10_40_38]|uniref:Uncharacterized protein n=1 Tax=Candidatus Harrisonbacteria bacterium CG10_big_fil_rev_8_21_14_0_10_40_38 TaxID=1974583 RepID=A0A2H0UT60_9BACT|nr:MAG: hypothetical protein COU07_01790 [Candidatus Harrisonbacteria bacterium CG10_big_fil_rev_8_21_14_0_10_40_38]